MGRFIPVDWLTGPGWCGVGESAENSHRTKDLVRVTMACNERCPFCNVPVEDYPQPTPLERDLETQVDALLASGGKTLTLSGGEPTLLRKRLLRLIRRARSGGIPFVELQTNAVLIDAAYAAELAEAGLTSAFVSLLGHEAEDHDHLAGLQGAFSRCLLGLDALAAAGVELTLNPVIARRTQAKIADYVEFVGRRLPSVRSISLSAVQPHGRAAGNLAELLPDYPVLALEVPRAQQVAKKWGIRLLNPYCGLPLCVGWVADRERSVEAIEAEMGGWQPTLGLENLGDKFQGPACAPCAWRTRCGGAWRAVWTERGGAGLQPPHRRIDPWSVGALQHPAQQVIHGFPGPSVGSFGALRVAPGPTVWLHVGALASGDAAQIQGSGCTDLALDLDPRGLLARDPTLVATLHEARILLLANRDRPATHKLRVHLRVRGDEGPETLALLQWAARVGVDRVVRSAPSSVVSTSSVPSGPSESAASASKMMLGSRGD
jgi:MoaA/NifB/PqqE/SkfB family radical SAM enzyme